MANEISDSAQAALTASQEEIPAILLSGSAEVLRSLIENPAFDETHVCLLLERKDLSANLIEEIARRKTWKGVYGVRRALAAHPRTPRLVAMRALRDLHLMDVVRITLLPSSSAEIKRMAEERILAQLPQLPLGQRLTLARRASARVAAGLILHGPGQVAGIALDNPFLTEAQLLKTLSRESLASETLGSVAKHEKWRRLVNIRIALLLHRCAPDAHAADLVLELPRRDIEDLLGLSRLSPVVRAELQQELSRRETRAPIET